MTSKQKLVSKGDGLYELEGDEQNTYIALDTTYETECDDPHPARVRADGLSEREREDLIRGGAKVTYRNGVEYVSYYCWGHETHYYSMWTVMVNGDWTDDVYETFAQARAVLEREIGPVVLARPRRTPPPVVLTDDEQHERTVLRDELRAIDEFLARTNELLKTDMGPFVDRDLVATNRRRKIEVVNRLSTLASPTPVV